MVNKSNIKKSWTYFGEIVLNPSVLILLTATVFLIHYTTSANANTEHIFYPVILVIISVLSSVIGGLITNNYSKITGASILVTRGKSAIRGLRLLTQNIDSIEKRTVKFLGESEDINSNTFKDLTKSNYEEIIERCKSVQQEALNAIEEWQDIIPEANITSNIGKLAALKTQILSEEESIQELKKQLEEGEKKSKEEKAKLEKLLMEKEKQVEKSTQSLSAVKNMLSKSILANLQDIMMESYFDNNIYTIKFLLNDNNKYSDMINNKNKINYFTNNSEQAWLDKFSKKICDHIIKQCNLEGYNKKDSKSVKKQ